jgi:UPF0176 protein
LFARKACVLKPIIMAVLHNRVSNKELKEKLQNNPEPRCTISFYRYVTINDATTFRDALYKTFAALDIYGRIYIAQEGINAQMSLPVKNMDALKLALDETIILKNLRLNIAVDDNGKSFWVLTIKVKKHIVADNINDDTFDASKTGKYVNAETFNALTNDAETVIVDMRNHYEYEVGHFKNAVELPSDSFRDQLPMAVDMLEENKDKNIVMYCTGGIRCEKASAYMLHKGFKNVYHLEGGIINYVKMVNDNGLENKFIGKNFVFDDRLGERITDDVIAHCHQCGTPADTHVNCINEGCHLLFIQCESCNIKFDACCSNACKAIIALPLEEQKELRKGIKNDRMVFKKGRFDKNKLE